MAVETSSGGGASPFSKLSLWLLLVETGRQGSVWQICVGSEV